MSRRRHASPLVRDLPADQLARLAHFLLEGGGGAPGRLARRRATAEQLEAVATAAGRIGGRLVVVRESRLWAVSHDSFEAYCRDELELTPAAVATFVRAAERADAGSGS